MTDQVTQLHPAHNKAGKHYHHGKTPAAWAGTLTATVGFFIGGFGMVLGPNWVMFWIGAALLVVALIVTAVLRQLGYGAN